MQVSEHDCRTIATIEADVIQALATDNFGGPLTEDELEQLEDILSAADKSDLIAEAILQLRPWLAPERNMVNVRRSVPPAEFPLNIGDHKMTYLPYELNHCELVATIGAAEIQDLAEDVYGRPLTDKELYDVAILLAEADKSDLLHDAIGEVLSRII